MIIFELPNGLLGYFLVDNAGDVIHKGPTGIVRQIAGGPQNLQSVIVGGMSCMSCHHAGILKKNDQVRDFVAADTEIFNQIAKSKLAAIYRPVAETMH